MKALHPRTLGIAPLYLMDGLRAPLQACLNWLWWAELQGEAWTLTGLAKKAGMGAGTLKKCLDELTEMCIIFPNDTKRAPFSVNVDFVPSREPAKEEKKKAETFPDWVFAAKKAWLEGRGGVVGPRDVHTALAVAVGVQGEGKVLTAFSRYASEGDVRFDTLKRFAENMGKWGGGGVITAPRAFGED